MGFNRQQVPKYQNAAAKSKGAAMPQKQAPQQAQMANMLRGMQSQFGGGQSPFGGSQQQLQQNAAQQGNWQQRLQQSQAAPTTLAAGQNPVSNISGMGQPQQPQPIRDQLMKMGAGFPGGPPAQDYGSQFRNNTLTKASPMQPQIGMQQGRAQQQNKWNAMPAQEQAKYDQSTQQQMGQNQPMKMGAGFPGGPPIQGQQQGNWQQRMGQSPLGRAQPPQMGQQQRPQMGGKGGNSQMPQQYNQLASRIQGQMGGKGGRSPSPPQYGGKGGRSQMPSQYRR